MLVLDEAFNKIYFKLMTRYKDVLKGSLKKMLKFALEETDVDNRRMQLEAIKETFNLDDKVLNDYVLVVKMEQMYINISQDLDMILELVSDDEKLYSEFEDEFREIMEKQKIIEGMIGEFSVNSIEEEKRHSYSFNSSKDEVSLASELSSNCNFVVYLSNVENERAVTVGSKSGKGISAMMGICKEIAMLSKSNYELLRQNGKIHQIQESNKFMSGRVLTSDNVAYERVGGGSTKVGYIRVPVEQANLELLKKKYNNSNLRYLILVISFGDFKNDGIDEKKLYDKFNTVADNYMGEIEKIVEIFKKPFTPESFSIAMGLIEQGIDITKLLIDNPMKPIVSSNKYK